MEEFFVAQTAAVKTVSQLAKRRFDLDVVTLGIKMNYKRDILEKKLEKLLSAPLDEENSDKEVATGPEVLAIENGKSGEDIAAIVINDNDNDNVIHVENGSEEVNLSDEKSEENSTDEGGSTGQGISSNGFPVGVCCVGDRLCKYPTHELRPQHKCLSCDKVVHVLCAVVDGENDEIECKMCRSILE